MWASMVQPGMTVAVIDLTHESWVVSGGLMLLTAVAGAIIAMMAAQSWSLQGARSVPTGLPEAA